MSFLGIGGGDYGASGYQSSADNALKLGGTVIGQQGGIAAQYGTNAAQNQGLYNIQQNTSNAANNAYDAYLGQDQSTDQNFAARTAANLGNYENQFAQQGAHGAQSMFTRGLDTPESASASSTGSSINAYLQAQKALGVLGAQQTAANQQYAANGQRLQTKANFDNGLAGQSYGRAMGALSAQNGVYGQQFGEYGQQAQAYTGLASQALQRQAADNQELGGLIGGVASLYGMGAFGGGGGGADGSVTPYTYSGPSTYSPNDYSAFFEPAPSYEGSIGSSYGAAPAGAAYVSGAQGDVSSFFQPAPNYSTSPF